MNDTKTMALKCPTCKKSTQYDTAKFPDFPFCSTRCKMIDLGAWASEDHKIEGDSEGYDDHFSEEGTF
jgi:endogenous inhibitor of DNA gyrase (YacG/DUF329 family)